MDYPRSGEKIAVRNLLYLTDFSRSSEAALPCAKALARAYNAKIYALHVLVPDVFTYMTPDSPAAALDLQEEAAVKEMKAVEKRLADLPHTVHIERANDVWSGVQDKLMDYEIDLIVLGTHGRSGLGRFVLGSSAEQILRKSPVPVMVVGPVHGRIPSEGHFHRVVFPSDFTPQSQAAAQYAVSVAQENQAALTLLHVIAKDAKERRTSTSNLSIAEALHRLHEIVPQGADLHCRPETVVEHGEPAARILDTAKEKKADLIVLGVRGNGSSFAATHLNNTAHRIIVRSACPVLTVRAPAA
jgi:nucleotide-binding universal stress UspA family protein